MINPILSSVQDPRVQRILSNPRNKLSAVNSVLNTKRHPDRTTDQFIETDDIGVVDTLNQHGWYVVDYNELKTHGGKRQGFQKYCATYENDSLQFKTQEGKARIVQIGAHDGTTKLSLHAGFFRWACLNGLVCGDGVFDPIRIKHVGEQPLQLDRVVEKLADTAPLVFRKIDQMNKVTLTGFEAVNFARKAAELRFGEGQSVDTADVLKVRRAADEGLNLWKVFNRVQENILRPADDFKMTTADNKIRKVKATKAIDASVRINKGLWHLAESFLH